MTLCIFQFKAVFFHFKLRIEAIVITGSAA